MHIQRYKLGDDLYLDGRRRDINVPLTTYSSFLSSMIS